MTHEWIEDELFGRYEVQIKLDTGTAQQAHALMEEARKLARSSNALGYELEMRYVIGTQQGRKTDTKQKRGTE